METFSARRPEVLLRRGDDVFILFPSQLPKQTYLPTFCSQAAILLLRQPASSLFKSFLSLNTSFVSLKSSMLEAGSGGYL